jgi:hypothetical protein
VRVIRFWIPWGLTLTVALLVVCVLILVLAPFERNEN